VNPHDIRREEEIPGNALVRIAPLVVLTMSVNGDREVVAGAPFASMFASATMAVSLTDINPMHVLLRQLSIPFIYRRGTCNRERVSVVNGQRRDSLSYLMVDPLMPVNQFQTILSAKATGRLGFY
jgi:hypothetical protein